MPDPPSPAALLPTTPRFGLGRLGRHPAQTHPDLPTLDRLTGLRNRRALWSELDQRTAACSPTVPLAVVVVDFDRLDEVNDRYDRAVGDAVLGAGTEAARNEAPSARLVFRSGDDELVLLATGDEEDGRELAERVRARIAAQNTDLPAVTVSCGVAAFYAPLAPSEALDQAGAALRAAKRAGGNRVAIATESDHDAATTADGDLTARRAALAMAVASLQARDRATADHSDDVVTLCASIGSRLGLGPAHLDRLAAGAQLHDVGKVAVPTQILNKPGPLDADEWAIIREHTVIGERMLRSVPEMSAVAAIVRHSHENWDGTGYPDGLAGEEIPLGSRIILCADAFHAIRSDRPYRPGRSADEALTEICACAGRQFDPRVVDALVSVARDVARRNTTTVALPRSRRLAALFAVLVVGGGGSAYATSEGVREAVGGVVEAVVPGAVKAPAAAGASDIALRPLADVPGLVPTAMRASYDFTLQVPTEALARDGSTADVAIGTAPPRTPERPVAITHAPDARTPTLDTGDGLAMSDAVETPAGAPPASILPDEVVPHAAAPSRPPAKAQPQLAPVVDLPPPPAPALSPDIVLAVAPAVRPETSAPALAPVTNLTKQPGSSTAANPHGGPPATGNPHGAPPALGNPHLEQPPALEEPSALGAPPAVGNPHGAPPALGNPHGAPPALGLADTVREAIEEIGEELPGRGRPDEDDTPPRGNPHGAPPALGNPHVEEPPATGNPHGAPPAVGNPQGEPPAVGNPHKPSDEAEVLNEAAPAHEDPTPDIPAKRNPQGEPPAVGNPHGDPPAVGNAQGQPPAVGNPQGEPRGQTPPQPQDTAPVQVTVETIFAPPEVIYVPAETPVVTDAGAAPPGRGNAPALPANPPARPPEDVLETETTGPQTTE